MVKLKKDLADDTYIGGDSIEAIIAIIELKYRGNYRGGSTPMTDKAFFSDAAKIGFYRRSCKINCLYYMGLIDA